MPRVRRHDATKPLRHLRLTRALVDGIVYFLTHQRFPETVYYSKSQNNYPLKKKIGNMIAKYDFRLSSKNDPRTNRQALNVVVNEPGNVQLYRVVAKEDVNDVIKSVYENPGEGGFRGRDAMYALLRRQYVGITTRDIQRFLDKRPLRQQLRPKKKRVSKSVRARRPMHIWQIDFIEMPKLIGRNRQYRYVCVIIDMFSKYLWVIPLRKRKQKTKQTRTLNRVAHFIPKLRELFETEGSPTVLQSDNEFNSSEYKNLLAQFNVVMRHSLPYTPQTNGGVERVNKTIKNCLRKCMVRSGGVWTIPNDDGTPGCLSQCVRSYNSHKHSATGYPPVELHRENSQNPVNQAISQRLGLQDDLVILQQHGVQTHTKPREAKIEEAAEQLTRTSDRRIAQHRQPDLQPNDLVRVYINRQKLRRGPCTHRRVFRSSGPTRIGPKPCTVSPGAHRPTPTAL